MRGALALAALLLAVTSASAAPQPLDTLEARLAPHRGRLVRVTLAGGAQLDGRLRGADARGLELERRGSGRLALEASRIARVELLPRGHLRGLLTGMLLGAGAAALLAADADEGDEDATRLGRVGAAAMAAGAMGALYDLSRTRTPELVYESPTEDEAPAPAPDAASGPDAN